MLLWAAYVLKNVWSLLLPFFYNKEAHLNNIFFLTSLEAACIMWMVRA